MMVKFEALQASEEPYARMSNAGDVSKLMFSNKELLRFALASARMKEQRQYKKKKGIQNDTTIRTRRNEKANRGDAA